MPRTLQFLHFLHIQLTHALRMALGKACISPSCSFHLLSFLTSTASKAEGKGKRLVTLNVLYLLAWTWTSSEWQVKALSWYIERGCQQVCAGVLITFSPDGLAMPLPIFSPMPFYFQYFWFFDILRPCRLWRVNQFLQIRNDSPEMYLSYTN